MIQNKAPHYDEVLEELEEKSMVETARGTTGNVIKFHIDSKTYGTFRPPRFPNWYVDWISLQPTDSTYKMRYVEQAAASMHGGSQLKLTQFKLHKSGRSNGERKLFFSSVGLGGPALEGAQRVGRATLLHMTEKEIATQLNELLERCEQTDGIESATVDVSVEISVRRDEKLVEDDWQTHYKRVVGEDEIRDLTPERWRCFDGYDLPTSYSIIDRLSKREKINLSD